MNSIANSRYTSDGVNSWVARDMLEIINVSLFMVTFAIKIFGDAYSQSLSSLDNVKYITMFVNLIVALMVFRRRVRLGYRRVFLKETNWLIALFTLYSFISCTEILASDKFSSLTALNLCYLYGAVVYAYLMINTLNFETFMKCMKVLLVLSFIGYVIEIGPNSFTLANVLKIDYQVSYSPFESSYSSSISIIMCAFFCCYREKKLWTLLAFVFSLLTFKRMFIVFAFIFLIIPMFVNQNKKVRGLILVGLGIFFVAATVAIYYLYQPAFSNLVEDITGSPIEIFSQGRNTLFDSLLSNNYVPFGYASTEAFLGRSLEMELLQIYLEMGIVGLVAFVTVFLSLTGRNAYCVLFMVSILMNSLFSHSLSGMFNWTLRYMIFACILYVQVEDPGYMRYRERTAKLFSFLRQGYKKRGVRGEQA